MQFPSYIVEEALQLISNGYDLTDRVHLTYFFDEVDGLSNPMSLENFQTNGCTEPMYSLGYIAGVFSDPSQVVPR